MFIESILDARWEKMVEGFCGFWRLVEIRILTYPRHLKMQIYLKWLRVKTTRGLQPGLLDKFMLTTGLKPGATKVSYIYLRVQILPGGIFR